MSNTSFDLILLIALKSHYRPFPQITNQDPGNNYSSQVRCSET